MFHEDKNCNGCLGNGYLNCPYGHNGAPLVDGKVCDACNGQVIRVRLELAQYGVTMPCSCSECDSDSGSDIDSDSDSEGEDFDYIAYRLCGL